MGFYIPESVPTWYQPLLSLLSPPLLHLRGGSEQNGPYLSPQAQTGS